MTQRAFIPVKLGILTVSDTRTVDTDTSGRTLFEGLVAGGHEVVERAIVSDDLTPLRARLREWIARSDIQVIISTGGTGVTARDVTPEALEPLITKRIEGFGELFRSLSYQEIGAATLQSRAVGAVCTGTLVFALPGSTAAVRLALDAILLPQLDHRTTPCNLVMLLDRL